MFILGISAYYHDSAAVIIYNDEIIAAAQEERFTRSKNDKSFPKNAIEYCLNEAGITINDLSSIVFYDKPLLTFERLLETYYAHAPKGIVSFINAIPVWTSQKLFLKRTLKQALSEIEDFDKKKIPILFTEHHLSHAASAFYASPFEESAILTIDGVGEWATASISKGSGKNIELVKELHYPNSLGLLYSAFTYFLGFHVNNGEYKVMGLAPYGNRDDDQTNRFIEVIKNKLVTIKADGSIKLHQKHFTYSTSMRMVKDGHWQKLLGIPKRKESDPFNQSHCNLALALQMVTEEVILLMAQTAKSISNSENLCLAGGVALNCVANGKLKKQGFFKNIFIQPAAGDAGGALGAALAAYHLYYDKDRNVKFPDSMKGAYLGPQYETKEVQSIARKFDGRVEQFQDFKGLIEQVASDIADGHVIGWFQDRMEFGPRALGNRSILADPSNPEMQKKVNLKVKFRESFRPFAPILLEEEVERLFDYTGTSPYMLMVTDIDSSIKKPLPSNWDTLDMKAKLEYPKSDFPAITHVDYSARLQTVTQASNKKMFDLLSKFKEKTGVGMLLNTSFNIKEEPIVCSPADAYNCFQKTGIDILVMNNFVLYKKETE